MGRIDEALRRSNLDASRGTGAPPSTPDASPWVFDRHDGRDEPAAPQLAPYRPLAAESSAPDLYARPLRSGEADTRIERLVAWRAASPLLVEQFRSLAATLLQSDQSLKRIVVTSASPGDGKSHVALNLALTLADSYQRQVVLIDADLRRPVLHDILRVPNSHGLSEALEAKTDEEPTAIRLSHHLTLIPAGRPEHNPLGGLSSDKMSRIVERAASHCEWVIVDSPPVGVLADGRLISDMVDGVLLVVRAGVTRFADLEAAVSALGRERILGVVLNAVDPAEIGNQNYYRHYYGQEPGRD